MNVPSVSELGIEREVSANDPPEMIIFALKKRLNYLNLQIMKAGPQRTKGVHSMDYYLREQREHTLRAIQQYEDLVAGRKQEGVTIGGRLFRACRK